MVSVGSLISPWPTHLSVCMFRNGDPVGRPFWGHHMYRRWKKVERRKKIKKQNMRHLESDAARITRNQGTGPPSQLPSEKEIEFVELFYIKYIYSGPPKSIRQLTTTLPPMTPMVFITSSY